nr:anoctamin-10-like [Lytechinus pictus]
MELNTDQEIGSMECDGVNPIQDPVDGLLEDINIEEPSHHDDLYNKASIQDIPLHQEDPSSAQNGSASSESCCNHSEDEDDDKMLCILQFSKSTNMATKNWLLSFLKAPEKEGGGELLVSTIQTKNNGDGDIVLQLGATRERLLEGAEKICIRKKCKDGSLREFSRGHRDHFDSGNKCFLTTCEKQRVIYYLLTNVRSSKEEDIPGTETKKLTLHPEQRIVPKMMNSGLIDGIYPLHTSSELISLENHWYNHSNYFQGQPIDLLTSNLM